MTQYTSHNPATIEKMLNAIDGVDSISDLFQDIPDKIKIEKLNLPNGIPEPNLKNKITTMLDKNTQYSASFMGAGNYFHYIPSIVSTITSLPQFYTAYTPYQAEASQGYLQAIFEYQSMISRLTQMDISNASMYDGATALAEATIMATMKTNKKKILLIEGIHPHYVEVVQTYAWGRNIEITSIPLEKLTSTLQDNPKEFAAVAIQSPNFFGDIVNIKPIAKQIKEISPKSLLIQVMTDPTCLGILQSPGESGVDIFVSEGQSFVGLPSFGGSALGIIGVSKSLMRKMPGRLIGKTKELHGDNEGFVLTLQAREQHIRRERATSNICSNQALNMLSALIYLVSMGKNGLIEIAKQNFQKSNYIKKKLDSMGSVKVLNQKPTYNEFVLEVADNELVQKISQKCKDSNFLPPLSLEQFYPEKNNQMLICTTELTTKEQMNAFVSIISEVCTQ